MFALQYGYAHMEQVMKPYEATEIEDRTSADHPAISATLSFLHSASERPYNYAYEPPPGTPWENYDVDKRVVDISDARLISRRTKLDIEGFTLWDAPTALTDFSNRDDIILRYYKEVVELACSATGASRGYVFDHLVRQRHANRSELDFGRSVKGAPVSANGRVHNDYTEESGRRRLSLVFDQLDQKLPTARYAIVNVWRSIKAPVLDTPLAVCDARSVDAADLINAEVRYPQRTGEIYLVKHGIRQRWFYFSAMDKHEALIFKQYDSQVSGVARFTPHAAFDHPNTPADAIPRESIEARCLVIYD